MLTPRSLPTQLSLKCLSSLFPNETSIKSVLHTSEAVAEEKPADALGEPIFGIYVRETEINFKHNVALFINELEKCKANSAREGIENVKDFWLNLTNDFKKGRLTLQTYSAVAKKIEYYCRNPELLKITTNTPKINWPFESEKNKPIRELLLSKEAAAMLVNAKLEFVENSWSLTSFFNWATFGLFKNSTMNKQRQELVELWLQAREHTPIVAFLIDQFLLSDTAKIRVFPTQKELSDRFNIPSASGGLFQTGSNTMSIVSPFLVGFSKHATLKLIIHESVHAGLANFFAPIVGFKVGIDQSDTLYDYLCPFPKNHTQYRSLASESVAQFYRDFKDLINILRDKIAKEEDLSNPELKLLEVLTNKLSYWVCPYSSFNIKVGSELYAPPDSLKKPWCFIGFLNILTEYELRVSMKLLEEGNVDETTAELVEFPAYILSSFNEPTLENFFGSLMNYLRKVIVEFSDPAARQTYRVMNSAIEDNSGQTKALSTNSYNALDNANHIHEATKKPKDAETPKSFEQQPTALDSAKLQTSAASHTSTSWYSPVPIFHFLSAACSSAYNLVRGYLAADSTPTSNSNIFPAREHQSASLFWHTPVVSSTHKAAAITALPMPSLEIKQASDSKTTSSETPHANASRLNATQNSTFHQQLSSFSEWVVVFEYVSYYASKYSPFTLLWNKVHALSSQEIDNLKKCQRKLHDYQQTIESQKTGLAAITGFFQDQFDSVDKQLTSLTTDIELIIKSKQATSCQLTDIKSKLDKVDTTIHDLARKNKDLKQIRIKERRVARKSSHTINETVSVVHHNLATGRLQGEFVSGGEAMFRDLCMPPRQSFGF